MRTLSNCRLLSINYAWLLLISPECGLRSSSTSSWPLRCCTIICPLLKWLKLQLWNPRGQIILPLCLYWLQLNTLFDLDCHCFSLLWQWHIFHDLSITLYSHLLLITHLKLCSLLLHKLLFLHKIIHVLHLSTHIVQKVFLPLVYSIKIKKESILTFQPSCNCVPAISQVAGPIKTNFVTASFISNSMLFDFSLNHA